MNPIKDGESLRGFDSYVVTLGDLMRGERATLGKSIEEAAADLSMRPTHIRAIENGNLDAFELPIIVGGYVRSYARYLGMDPEATFQKFCEETGYSSLSVDAFGSSGVGSPGTDPAAGRGISAGPDKRRAPGSFDSLERRTAQPLGFSPRRPFARSVMLSAVFNMSVLVVLVSGLIYGGWKFLHEIQQVRIVADNPVEANEGDFIASLWLPSSGDPPDADLGEARIVTEFAAAEGPSADPSGPSGSSGGLDRLHRPQVLEMPIIQPRDEPIAAIDPDEFGTLVDNRDAGPTVVAEVPQVIEDTPQTIEVFAANPAWIRVFVDGGDILFEQILDAGQRYSVPPDVLDPLLRSGNSGSVYLVVDGTAYGPVGTGTSVAKRVSLLGSSIVEAFDAAPVVLERDERAIARRTSVVSTANGE
ncbi:MAG: DUF4115 domain-containing protein [Paracoccaceae bacterium]|nr:DUF4115 domain-containing protein [Paracoccaceae bacterium]MDE2914818.1 DUF4115 domain-containing protein [Paracoccaceae bacterium]